MNKVVNELNAYLKGEYMAIDSYERFIQSVNDKDIKIQLQGIQKDHKRHAIKVAERIQNLGGRPAASVGLGGKVAEAMSSVKYIEKNDDHFYVQEAYNGEDKGIRMAEEVVKGDLDKDSAVLIKNILDTDREHLNVLQSIIKH